MQVKRLVEIVLGEYDSKNTYSKMMDSTISREVARMICDRVTENPSILIKKFDSENFVFDFFFHYVLYRCHPAIKDDWMHSLYVMIEAMTGLGEWGNIIKSNSEYVLKCQANSYDHSELFEVLFDNDFDLGDIDKLLYTVVARGELRKIQKIYEVYTIEEHSGIFSTALRYGRCEIIKYLLDSELDVTDYGNILHFEFFEESPRIMYYVTDVCDQSSVQKLTEQGPISGTTQDYLKCLQQLQASEFQPVVNLRTLNIWCDFARSKIYDWDRVPDEVFLELKSMCSEAIPMNHDFGIYTEIIMGSNYREYSNLQEQLSRLESQVRRLEFRNQRLTTQNNTLRKKCELLERRVIVRRKRCVTK